jgi:hypothetical protein
MENNDKVNNVIEETALEVVKEILEKSIDNVSDKIRSNSPSLTPITVETMEDIALSDVKLEIDNTLVEITVENALPRNEIVIDKKRCCFFWW